MYLSCVLPIAAFEIGVFIVKIQQYAQLMEDPRKHSSMQQQPFRLKYKDNFNISWSLLFFNNKSCFQNKSTTQLF